MQTESVVLQAIFHYRACLSSNETLLDDSRKIGKDGRPFELLIGKKFSLEMWEEAIQTMRVGEVASFVSPIQVNASLFFFNFYLINYTFCLQFALHWSIMCACRQFRNMCLWHAPWGTWSRARRRSITAVACMSRNKQWATVISMSFLNIPNLSYLRWVSSQYIKSFYHTLLITSIGLLYGFNIHWIFWVYDGCFKSFWMPNSW